MRLRRPTPKETALFLYVWLMVGFATGTVVLLWPVRWITSFARGRGWVGAEDVMVWTVIALFVSGSFLLALWLTRMLREYRSRAFKFGVLGLATAAAGVALWGWMNPAVFAEMSGVGVGSGEEVALRSGAHFVFGAYPDRERLLELKDEGVTAVVSLQHPAVVPFEPQGIARGRKWTEELGIRFVHAPMLPWLSDNAESLEVVRRLAAEGEGTYYVHCGLGRDRVNVVRRMLQGMSEVRMAGASEEALGWGDRVEEGLGDLERGAPIRLARDVWLVPHPNEHEIFGHMLAGQVAHVLLLLDPEHPDEARWLAEARETFERFDLPFTHLAVARGEPGAAGRAAAVADTLPRPLTVIAPYTPPEPDTATATAFRRAWVSMSSREGYSGEAATGSAAPDPAPGRAAEASRSVSRATPSRKAS